MELKSRRHLSAAVLWSSVALLVAGSRAYPRRALAESSPGSPAGERSGRPDHGEAHAATGASDQKGQPTVPEMHWFQGGTGMYVPPFYDQFKSLDLSSLSNSERERFLHWVNTEYCTCGQQGCRRDTIANCFTNDFRCPRAPLRIREILERVKKGETLPGPASSATRRPAAPPG